MSSRTENLVPALESGADDFVSKPPSLEELKARLRTAERVTAIQAELINRASTDHLTGMMTRRRFFEAATQVWAESPSRICILLCDLDNFKYVNDRHGHEIGDKLLVEVGKLLVATGAAAGRLGGEEFAILCQAGKSESLKLAASIREAVARITIPADTGYVRATCSIGVAERVMDESIDVLLKRADLALYQAKSAGRNRVIEAVTPFRSSIASIPRQNRCMLLEQGC
jgi:diguanylate cyclase (GGDEF)-like protein